MPRGGLAQLLAYGAQDVYLTGNPSITRQWTITYNRGNNIIPDNKIDFELLNNKYVETDNISDCSICIITKSNIITSCEHQYCKTCLDEWLNKQNKKSCPYCRNNLCKDNLFKIPTKRSRSDMTLSENKKRKH